MQRSKDRWNLLDDIGSRLIIGSTTLYESGTFSVYSKDGFKYAVTFDDNDNVTSITLIK